MIIINDFIKFDKYIIDYNKELLEPLYYISIVKDTRTQNKPILVTREFELTKFKNSKIYPCLKRFFNRIIRFQKLLDKGLIIDGVITYNRYDYFFLNNLNSLCELETIFRIGLYNYSKSINKSKFIKKVWDIDIDQIIKDNYISKIRSKIPIRGFFNNKGLNYDNLKENNDELYDKYYNEWVNANNPIIQYNNTLESKTYEIIINELINTGIIDNEGNIICLE